MQAQVSSKGYNGVCISWADIVSPTIDDTVDRLRNYTKQMIPPIMVAHSLSSFVAQKYLESHALAGLVLMNPLPGNVTIGTAVRLRFCMNVMLKILFHFGLLLTHYCLCRSLAEPNAKPPV